MMASNIDENACSLDALILTATNPLVKHEDPIAVQAVVQAVCRDPTAPQMAVKILAHKIHSPQEREAMKALSVLQACIINCGSPFHSEIGKFRFLNEMIKLVSPKYAGNHTPPAIKSRVLELLFCWMTDLTHEPKIAEAYNMLKKQGVVTEDPVYIGPLTVTLAPRPATSTIEDNERSRQLKRLLQSKRPEDLDRANALIQAMVRDDQKRIERNTQCAMELEVARNNVKVLDEMLSEHEKRGGSGGELSLMSELQQTCTTLRDTLFQTIARCADTNEDISEMITVNEELTRVIGRYKVLIDSRHGKAAPQEDSKKTEDSKNNEDMLLDLSSPEKEKNVSSTTTDLINKELSELGLGSLPSSSSSSTHVMDSMTSATSISSSLLELSGTSFSLPKVKGSEDLPPPLVASAPLTQVSVKDSSGSESPSHVNPLDDLDILVSAMPKSAHPLHVGPHFKQPEKLTMNQLALLQMSSTNNQHSTGTTANDSLISPVKSSSSNSLSSALSASDLNSLAKSKSLLEDGEESNNLRENSSTQNSSPSAQEKKESPKQEKKAPQYLEVKPLTDIKISIESIQPSNQTPLSLISTGSLTTTLHHTLNSPRPDVSVLVLSTTSRSPLPITQYVMQAVVPRACKVRLLAPSSTEMPQYSPFLPPPAITQIMLLANPNEVNVSLKLMLSYSVQDEAVTEMAEVDHLTF